MTRRGSEREPTASFRDKSNLTDGWLLLLSPVLYMTKKQIERTGGVPPQLIGVLADAVAIGATAFRLEPFPRHFMASFSVPSQAGEIDFENLSGQEMMDFLLGKITDPKAKSGSFVLEYEGKRYQCRVMVDRTRNPQRAEVSWALPASTPPDKPQIHPDSR